MTKIFRMLCLVISLLVSVSGCTNASRGSGTERGPGTVVDDAAITTDIKTKFIADNEIRAFRIDVDTYKGVVTLSGTVPNQTAYDRAVRLARETKGVVQVVPKLTIR
jgi:hyperosmotically inducible protein